MTKLMYLVVGLLMLSGTAMMVGAAPDAAHRAAKAQQDAMGIRTLERTIDVNTLPNGDLDAAVYQ